MAERALLKIVYLLTCQILGLIVVLARGDQAAAEVVVLRHENAVLRRQVGRVRYELADWAWFAALARLVSRRRWAEVFPGHAPDAPGLAPQAGGEEVRHERLAQVAPAGRRLKIRPSTSSARTIRYPNSMWNSSCSLVHLVLDGRRRSATVARSRRR